MRRMKIWGLSAAVVAMSVLAGCTISKVEPPPLTGPSELGLSLQLTANPDVLTQDGASQSLIKIQARDANSQPARSIALRAEITVGGVIVDFGRLSARNLVTDNNGQAAVMYTAPPFVGVDEDILVTIVVTPSESDNRNAVARQLDIRLVPPGVRLPPNDPPKANFTFTPSTPQVAQNVVFDASASTDDVSIASYVWDFGDGSTGSGRIANHQFHSVGVFSVTLTVTDDRGKTNETTQAVSVGAGTPPIALFTFSPGSPGVNQDIVFNAAASRASAGRTIVRYDWNFGSGSPQQGMVVTKSYDTAGTYNVTLTVTDDADQQATTQLSVTVSTAGPTAFFTFTAGPLTAGQTITFNASASTTPNGSTIVAYRWDFGDATTRTTTTPTVDKVYSASGTSGTNTNYNVTLTVTNSTGQTGTTTNTVTVRTP